MYLIEVPHKILFSKQYRPTFSNLSEYIRPLSPCIILDALSFASFHFYDTFIIKRKLRLYILLQMYDLIFFFCIISSGLDSVWYLSFFLILELCLGLYFFNYCCKQLPSKTDFGLGDADS